VGEHDGERAFRNLVGHVVGEGEQDVLALNLPRTLPRHSVWHSVPQSYQPLSSSHLAHQTGAGDQGDAAHRIAMVDHFFVDPLRERLLDRPRLCSCFRYGGRPRTFKFGICRCLSGDALAQQDAVAGGNAKKFGDAPNRVCLEFVDCPIGKCDIPQHFHDFLPTVVVESALQDASKIVEINSFAVALFPVPSKPAKH
jgi:hypothetical protein